MPCPARRGHPAARCHPQKHTHAQHACAAANRANALDAAGSRETGATFNNQSTSISIGISPWRRGAVGGVGRALLNSTVCCTPTDLANKTLEAARLRSPIFFAVRQFRFGGAVRREFRPDTCNAWPSTNIAGLDSGAGNALRTICWSKIDLFSSSCISIIRSQFASKLVFVTTSSWQQDGADE